VGYCRQPRSIQSSCDGCIEVADRYLGSAIEGTPARPFKNG
jgi:hypothetical protein